jgi:Flp pilus assembly protein TadD
MNPTRLSTPSAEVQSQRPSFWEPARLLLASLGGLLALAICSSFLGEYDSGRFAEFLKGQVGFDGMLSCALFWKMAIAFALGTVAGYFISLEIPSAHYKKFNLLALGAALFLIPVVVYIPAMSAGFLWDDDQEISGNPSLLQVPVDPARPTAFRTNWYGLWEIWTGGITNDRAESEARAQGKTVDAPLLVSILRPPLRAFEREVWGGADKEHYRFRANQSADYFPLKTTLLWVEYQLWGYDTDASGRPSPSAPPFHVMNILFHALDGLLLWLVLSQLKVPGAWLGALLFAVHPVHAESVAWIAERKNTLSLFFVLLSVSAWIKWEDGGNRKHYYWSLGLFAAALLCKTHVVVYPAVLMLLTWWRTGRESLGDLWRSCVRTAPFWVVAIVLSAVTVWFQNDRAIGGEVIPIGNGASRIAGAGVMVWWYLSKVLLPINLNTIYANSDFFWWPLKDPAAWMFLAGGAVLLLLGFFWAIKEIYPTRNPRADRTPFFVFAFFVGTLTPVMGFFTMSYMRLTLPADHFQYFSDIAVLAMVGAGLALLYEKADASWRPIVVGACVVVVASCCAYSWERAGVHQSEKTLWTACLEKNEASWQAHNHIGAVLYKEQKVAEAAPHFARAVELKPENPEVHNNLGLVLWQFGRKEEAIAQYRESVRIKGEVMALRQNLASALMMDDRVDEALEQFQIMEQEAPKDPNLHLNLGIVYARLNRWSESRQEFETCLKLFPGHPGALQNLELLRKMGH